jgi:hypothetical protein
LALNTTDGELAWSEGEIGRITVYKAAEAEDTSHLIIEMAGFYV